MTTADLAVRGGRVFTADRSNPWAEVVAVRDGRIVAVGSASQVESLLGPGTRVVEARGGLVAPSFQDSHVHPDGGGLAMKYCSLHDLHGEAAYLAAIRSYVEAHPDAQWIVGDGWTLSDFAGGTPHRSLLDSVVPERPAYVENRDGHGAWVNSKALELAGIDASTPDPVDGRIEREPDGAPFGMLHEGAMHLVLSLVPPPTDEELLVALLAAQAHLHALGITAWQDAHVSPRTHLAYRTMEARGELTARVVGALWWDRTRGLEQIEGLRELRAEAGASGRYRPTSVKIMQDGIVENFTAGLVEPYLRQDGNRGKSFVEPNLLKEVVTRLDADGFQVHVHAIGDRAAREALDAFEAARDANGPNDLRHHIAHLQVVHPDDVPRFAALGVVANGQPLWACMEPQMRELNLPFLGEERARTQYPFGALLRSGARLAFGSDWPVTTPDPLQEMQIAVTRTFPEEPESGPWLPDERLTLDQALEAFTMGTAFVNHLDGETGSLEVGKAADMAIIQPDPFTVDPMEIGRCRVVATLTDGRTVFEES
jgi:predicted amidohydrolase YtcJ